MQYPSPASTPSSGDGVDCRTTPAQNNDPPKRKRTARACDSCYKRKIQCDAVKPQCNWCKHHDLPCTFDRVIGAGRKKKNEAKRDLSLSERIERIENFLATSNLDQGQPNGDTAIHILSLDGFSGLYSASVSGSPSVYHCSPSQQPCSFGRMHFAGCNLGQISSHNGLPLFSPEGQQWIKEKTGEDSNFDMLQLFGPLWQNNRHSNGANLLSLGVNSGSPSVELPDRAAVEFFLAGFTNSKLRSVFPVLDPVLFQDTLNMAYAPLHVSERPKVMMARAAVFAFLALASVFECDRYRCTLQTTAEQCASTSWHLVTQFEQASMLDGLQAAVMLCLFHTFVGAFKSSEIVLAVACRVVTMLGGHIMQPVDPTPTMDKETRTRRHIRNLFWLCYSMDKGICQRTGHPPLLVDDYCDLTLPTHYTELAYRPQDPQNPNQEPFVPMYPLDLNLSIIHSRAHAALYSFKAGHKSDAEILKDIRELDDELEQWRMSIPAPYRPTLTFTQDPGKCNSMDMHAIVLHLAYHHAVATIHRASGRCRAWRNSQSCEFDGVTSSLAISVQACRSSLYCLESTVHTVAADCFWMLLYYPLYALLIIFCNILRNPLDPQAEYDLALLMRVPHVLKMIRTRRLTFNDVAHTKLIDDFVNELTRLGRCAIAKAKRERDFNGGN